MAVNAGSTNRRRAEGGFTIVETLVALVLLLVGFLALNVLHIGVLRASSLARRNTLATILASEQIERFQRVGMNSITAGSDTASLDGRSFNRSWTTSAVPQGGALNVAVAISWSDQWGSHTITVPSVVRPGP